MDARFPVEPPVTIDPLHPDWSLRWFTPAVEVALCGHATLASAHALFEDGLLPSEGTARFHTKSGVLTVTMLGGELAV